MEPLDQIEFTLWEVEWIRYNFTKQVDNKASLSFVIKSELPIFRPLAFNKGIMSLIIEKASLKKDLMLILHTIRQSAYEACDLWDEKLQYIDTIRSASEKVSPTTIIGKYVVIEIKNTKTDPFYTATIDFSEVKEALYTINYHLFKYCSHILKTIQDVEILKLFDPEPLKLYFKDDAIESIFDILKQLGVIEGVEVKTEKVEPGFLQGCIGAIMDNIGYFHANLIINNKAVSLSWNKIISAFSSSLDCSISDAVRRESGPYKNGYSRAQNLMKKNC